jgi:hypothetical protein
VKNGGLLIYPVQRAPLELAEQNRQLLETSPCEVAGSSLREFRGRARAELLERVRSSALNRLAAGLNQSAEHGRPDLWLVTGHQPVLAHPGVWVKHAAVAALTAQAGAGVIGLNLVVDTDLLGQPGTLVPVGTRDAPRQELVRFLSTGAAQPWEEVSVTGDPLLESWGDRVTQLLQPWGITPLAGTYWETVRASSERSLAVRFTAARCAQEQCWGWQNHECLLSEVAGLPAFGAFLGTLAAAAPQFAEIYNASVREYRRRNHIRSLSHPVPELAASQGRVELPCWAWRKGDLQRLGVLCEPAGKGYLLSAGETPIGRLLQQSASAEELGLELEPGWKLRPRALLTTLFARLCLADLFIHGIGGAKYDEITDQIIRQFFGIEPPAYLTVTATLRLPLPLSGVQGADLQRLREHVRDLQFNPDRALKLADDHPLVARKQQLLHEVANQRAVRVSRAVCRQRRAANRQRHLALLRIQQELAGLAHHAREQALEDLQRLSREWQLDRLLGSREYAAVLHPEPNIRQLLDHCREVICLPAAQLAAETDRG